MMRTSFYDLNDQYKTPHDRISMLVLSLYILSIVLTIAMNLFLTMNHLPVLKFVKVIILFTNIWGLGFLVCDIFFFTKHKTNDTDNKTTYPNSRQSLFMHIILPISLGIMILCFFGLFVIIAFNMLNLSDITERIFNLFAVFYISEFLLAIIYLSLNFKKFKSLLNQQKQLIPQIMSFEKVKTFLISKNSFKSFRLILMLLLSILILSISMFLGEINYNFEILNIILVYLFFLAIILLLALYLHSKTRTRTSDAILVFILAFSLAHLFISRGPTLVGRTDIHNEFLYAQNTLTSMNWDPNEFEENYNTIISITIFPMVLSVIFGVKIETFFELVNPVIFGLFNVINYLILLQIYSKYNFENPMSRNQKINKSSPFSVLFSIFIILFIRSYTHIIAASARIVIAYFAFSIFCLLLIDDKLLSGFRRSSILFILLTFVFLSHWGTFFFGVIVIITSFIGFLFYLSLNKYNLLLNFSKLINKQKIKKIFFNSVFIVAFSLLVIVWFFVITPQVIIYIQEHVIPTVENSLDKGIENFIPQVMSLLGTYRMINFSNPIISFETIINILFGFIIVFTTLSKVIRIFRLKNVDFSDFFGVSSFLVMGLMLLIPVLSSFYSPLRVGMQFWPFIAPIFFIKISFHRKIPARLNFPSFPQKILSINMRSVMTVFLFLLLCFHQGIVYEIVYSGDSSQPTEVLEVGESLSLVFRNYGVEAWRWVLTESDLQAIEWLSLQSPVRICADLSRTYMLNSRINTISEKNNSVVISFYPLQRFFGTYEDKYIWGNCYYFFSSQNIVSGSMFFNDEPNNTYRLISQLQELNSSLIYSNGTQIYYLWYR